MNHRAWVFVGFGLMIIVALGFWGLTAGSETVSTIGTAIDHDGGTYTTVDAWTIDDPMTAMMGGDGANADQFAQSGMPMGQMSQMMSDAVPEGMKRVAVELDLHAGDQADGLPHGTDHARRSTARPTVRTASLLADESLTPGSRLSGIVIFEVPIDAGNRHVPAEWRRTVGHGRREQGARRSAGDHPRPRGLTDRTRSTSTEGRGMWKPSSATREVIVRGIERDVGGHPESAPGHERRVDADEVRLVRATQGYRGRSSARYRSNIDSISLAFPLTTTLHATRSSGGYPSISKATCRLSTAPASFVPAPERNTIVLAVDDVVDGKDVRPAGDVDRQATDRVAIEERPALLDRELLDDC